jgi:hypothetical protein
MELFHKLWGQQMPLPAVSMVWTGPGLWVGAVIRFMGEDQAVDKDFPNIKFDIRRLEEEFVESIPIFGGLLDTIGNLQLDAAK